MSREIGWIKKSILAALLSFLRSSNHPIRSRQHIRRNREVYLLSCFQVDDELEFLRLLDWEVGGFSTFQNLVHVNSRAPIEVSEVRPIRHEAALIDILL